jgi:toxin ParE1/3/4
MKIIIRDAAYDDLERIHAWIGKDRPRAADAVIERILKSIGLLESFPLIGRAGHAPGTRELVIGGLPYIAVYRVDDKADEAVVIAVFHAAQNR